MDGECRALLDALQKRRSAAEVKKLITAKAAKTADIFYGLKPLFWALSYGHPFEVISELLKAYPEAASEKTEEGYTTLHYVEKLDVESAKLLLEKCPSAAAEKDDLGMMPLHWAAENDVSTDIAELLISANLKAAHEADNQGRLPYRIAEEHDASEGLLKVIAKANPRAKGGGIVLPIALVFPGPGSQYVGMLSKVEEDTPIAKDMLAEASAILGFDVSEKCLEGPEDELRSTLPGQPLLYIADMIALEKLRARKPEVVESCQAVAGLASGEIAALAAAGVFSFADGLILALSRAELILEAASLLPQGTISIAGLAEKKVADICQNASAAAGDGEFCQISNFLFEKGYTIGGTQAAIEQCEKMAKKAKAMQVRMLKDQGGFHTTLMQPAKDKYLKVLQDMMPKMSPPRCKVFMNEAPPGECQCSSDYQRIPQRAADAESGDRCSGATRVPQPEAPSLATISKHLANAKLEVVCFLEGSEPGSSSCLQARHSYSYDDIVYNAAFKKCVSRLDDGTCQINFDEFHEIVDAEFGHIFGVQSII